MRLFHQFPDRHTSPDQFAPSSAYLGPDEHHSIFPSEVRRMPFMCYLLETGECLCCCCNSKNLKYGETNPKNLAAICQHCGGGDWLIGSGVKCTSPACICVLQEGESPKELQALSYQNSNMQLEGKIRLLSSKDDPLFQVHTHPFQ